jgi:hypothetical protein
MALVVSYSLLSSGGSVGTGHWAAGVAGAQVSAARVELIPSMMDVHLTVSSFFIKYPPSASRPSRYAWSLGMEIQSTKVVSSGNPRGLGAL